jgi:hypothetical protein
VHISKCGGSCGIIILFNMVIVVVETDAGVDDGVSPLWAEVSTTLLLIVYTAEFQISLPWWLSKDFLIL